MILSQMEPSLQRLGKEMPDGRRIGYGWDRAGQRGRGRAVLHHHDQQRPAPAQSQVGAALPVPFPTTINTHRQVCSKVTPATKLLFYMQTMNLCNLSKV